MFKMRAKIISVGLLGTAAMLPLDFAKADQLGHASWYSLPANTTANGERMNPDELTAAHRSLPFGTRVLVENLTNGRSVVVRINDRGPFIGGRIIDLSKAAAESIGMIGAGTAQVRITTTAPDGGNALGGLGRSHRKGRNGVALAAKESRAEPHQVAKTRPHPARFIEAKNHSARTPKLSTVASLSPVKAKTRVAFSLDQDQEVAMQPRLSAKSRGRLGAAALEEDGANTQPRAIAPDPCCRLLLLQACRTGGGRAAPCRGVSPSLCDLRQPPGFMQPAAS